MLFELQRSQVLHLEDMSPDESGSESAGERVEIVESKKKVDTEGVARKMMGWRVENPIDRKLVLGILQDKAKLSRYT